MKNVYAVILAGGSGTRFWPKSRHQKPKQLCKIGNATKTMLEITLDRLEGFIPPERRIIVTHIDQVEATRQVVKNLCPRIIPEPEAKNTANAIALAALEVQKMAAGKVENPIMISWHADHVITKVPEFMAVTKAAIEVAGDGHLTLLGITPRYPETGYGYIERGSALSGSYSRTGYKVNSFKEKPKYEVAVDYIKTGKYFWNAGLFVWKVDAIISELKERQPVIIQKLSSLLTESCRSFLDVPFEPLVKAYRELPKISIDHAVLELSNNVAIVEADIGWQDVGSWDALSQCFPVDDRGNINFGDSLLLDSYNTTVDTDGPFVATIGVKDMVVICSNNAILVCPKERTQDVKFIVENLKDKRRSDLL